jgi:hypothetical protein
MEQQQLTTPPINSNAIAIYQRMDDPLDAITKMGQMFASSGMFGCSKLEQGQVLALACLVQGKDPFELMQNYYIINGSLSMKSVAVLANFMKAGGKVIWKSALNDVSQAQADFSIYDNSLVDAIYTISDAETEGLIAGPNKHNWKVRPADMLRARLITKAVRMIAPGIIMGMNAESDATNGPVPGPRFKVAVEAAPVDPEPPETHALELLRALETEDVTVQEAIDLCVSLKFLDEGETLADLTPTVRKRITKKLPEFITKIKAARAQPELTDATAS